MRVLMLPRISTQLLCTTNFLSILFGMKRQLSVLGESLLFLAFHCTNIVVISRVFPLDYTRISRHCGGPLVQPSRAGAESQLEYRGSCAGSQQLFNCKTAAAATTNKQKITETTITRQFEFFALHIRSAKLARRRHCCWQFPHMACLSCVFIELHTSRHTHLAFFRWPIGCLQI